MYDADDDLVDTITVEVDAPTSYTISGDSRSPESEVWVTAITADLAASSISDPEFAIRSFGGNRESLEEGVA